MTRWNLSIPQKTDRVVRTFLARTGGKKGDLSRFVDDAVRRRVLDLTVRQVKDRNNGYDQQEILDLIDDEVTLRVRVVLDTNILIGALSPKAHRRIGCIRHGGAARSSL